VEPQHLRLLEEGAAAIGLRLDREQVSLLSRHVDLLLRWNKSINLTSITDPAEVVEKHVIDSLALAPLVPAGTLLDAGTGAELLTLVGHTGDACWAEFSNDDIGIISVGGDGILKWWSAVTGEEIRSVNAHDNEIMTCRFSPDGASITLTTEGSALVVGKIALFTKVPERSYRAM